jgi:transposase InsO family protein
MITEKNMKHSFSRKGNPYDNACIESFHSVLKKEEVYLNTYLTFEEAETLSLNILSLGITAEGDTVHWIIKLHSRLKRRALVA